jgi:hypothetical protein
MPLSKKLQAMIEKEYDAFVNLYQPTTDVEEFTDIKHTAIQTLINWSLETGEPFDHCAKQFLKDFRAEIKNLKAQGFPERTIVARTLEHPHVS